MTDKEALLAMPQPFYLDPSAEIVKLTKEALTAEKSNLYQTLAKLISAAASLNKCADVCAFAFHKHNYYHTLRRPLP